MRGTHPAKPYKIISNYQRANNRLDLLFCDRRYLVFYLNEIQEYLNIHTGTMFSGLHIFNPENNCLMNLLEEGRSAVT